MRWLLAVPALAAVVARLVTGPHPIDHAAALQLALLVHWPNSFGTSYLADAALGRPPTSGDVQAGARVDAVVRSTAGEVIAEPAGFAVRNGRTVAIQPIDLRAEELRGRWAQRASCAGPVDGPIQARDHRVRIPASQRGTGRARFLYARGSRASPDGLTFRVYPYRQSAEDATATLPNPR
jgi:hypothetical protein